nr:hypothetical protein [uncultured Lachnoclostridium sp.]
MKRIIVTVLLLVLCVFSLYLNFELNNSDPYEIQISDKDLEEDDVNLDSAYKVSRTDISEYREEIGTVTFAQDDYHYVRLEKNSEYKICVKQGDIVKAGMLIAKQGNNEYRVKDKVRVINITYEDEIVITLLSYQNIICNVQLPQELINNFTYQSECYIVYNEIRLEGKIVHISDTIHKKTFEICVKVKERKMLLRPGMEVQVFILLSQRNGVIAIPNNYIYQFENGDAFACVDQDGSYKYKPIETGISDGKYTQIISGISENDIVYENFTYNEK